MSATLGEGGDLERLVGRRTIYRLPIPEGWDRQGVGRRFFMFPSMSLTGKSSAELRRKLMEHAGRSLVLVPSDAMREPIVKDVREQLRFAVFGSDDIEVSKKGFLQEDQAVAVVANRYDGIDFPGDDCRLLFIDGLPMATNLQERFLMTRMGANVLFNERVQVRVLQAVGRCTRSLEDYSAVVVFGEELTRYLTDTRRRGFLHPELQAEILFSQQQSLEVSMDDFLDNCRIFLENSDDWEEVNEQILALREDTSQATFPAIEELRAAVSHEIDFQAKLWQGDYDAACRSAEQVLAVLRASDLRGYRALWHYLAGSAAQMSSEMPTQRVREHFQKAKTAATSIRWLVRLARWSPTSASSPENNSIVMEQIERVENILDDLGRTYGQRYVAREKAILDGLRSESTNEFERAHELLGEMLGFEVGKVEGDASPDPWWIAGSICFVFEDHSGAQEASALSATKARQAASHPAWIADNVNVGSEADVVAVLVTPVKKAHTGAMPHLRNVALWPLEEFREWATNAMQVVRDLATSFSEAGDLAWREKAMGMFEAHGMDAEGLRATLGETPAAAGLETL